MGRGVYLQDAASDVVLKIFLIMEFGYFDV